MRRTITLIIISLMAIAYGCDKAMSDRAEDTLSISVPQSTRVYMKGLETYWDKGDAVTVFYKTETAEQWTFKGETGEMAGKISHEAISRKETRNDRFVLYPHDSDATLEGNVICTEIPSVQQYRKGSYGTAVLASRSFFDILTMEYCTAVMELEFKGPADISHIVLNGNDGEKLCGQSVISFDGESPLLSCDGGTSVSLDCNVSVDDSKTESFYFSIAPVTFSKGVTFTVYFQNGESHKVFASEGFSVGAGHIHTIEAISPILPYTQKVMHLLFSDGTDRQQPFEEDLVFQSEAVGKRKEYTYMLDGIGYHFYLFCQNTTSNEYRQTARGGLYIGGVAGDYIEFPAVQGYRLSSIGISVNKDSHFHIVPTDSPDTIIEGGTCSSIYAGDFRALHLTGTVAGKSYRMMLDNNSCFRFITLYYRK